MTSVPTAFPSSLADLTDAGASDPRFIDLVLPDIGGGRLQLADLNAIDARPDATVLRVSGLDQPTFEALVRRFGRQLRGLHLWKCPRVADLGPLEDCPNLTHVAYYWNQRASRLWDLSKTPDLRGLSFQDFSRLKTLDDVAKGVELEELEFGDAVWPKSVFASLSPLAGLQRLRVLTFNPKAIADSRIQPLAKLRSLRSFECSTNLFTTEQLAWLRARLPESTQGRPLEPIWRLETPLTAEGMEPRDVLVIGKRKPFLSSASDADRIERYVADFWALVERFRRDPSLEPS